MKKFLLPIFSALILIGCQSVPEIKHGPYCSSNAAYICHQTGIAYGTDAIQACIKDVQQRCAQGPKVQLTPREACLADAKRESGFCHLSVFGVPLYARQVAGERCVDRKQMQEDRCYARFK